MKQAYKAKVSFLLDVKVENTNSNTNSNNRGKRNMFYD